MGINIESAFDSIFLGPCTWLLQESFGVPQMDSVLKYLKLGDATFDKVWETVSTVYSKIQLFGIALITTFFIVHLIDLGIKDMLNVDSIIKALLSLIVAVTITSNLPTILNALMGFGDSLLGQVNLAQIEDPAVTAEDAYENLGATGANSLTILMKCFFIWLIHQIAIIAVDIAAFLRVIEIAWKSALAPIGVANCFDGGMQSSGIKYLRSFLGAVVAGVAMYLVCWLGFTLAFAIFTDATEVSTLLPAQGVLLATAGASIGVSNKAKEIVGG